MDHQGLGSLYYSFMHTYLNYGNVVWERTNENTFQKMKNLKTLNIQKKNLYHILNFMFRVKHDTSQGVFNKEFRTI